MEGKGGRQGPTTRAKGVKGEGREEGDDNSIVITAAGVKDTGSREEGEEGRREENAVETGKVGATVEGEGAGGRVTMTEGVAMIREVGGEEEGRGNIGGSSGRVAGMAVKSGVGCEIEVT